MNVVKFSIIKKWILKGSRMGRSAKVSLWFVTLLINIDFVFCILE